jgi:hypothetical protein
MTARRSRRAQLDPFDYAGQAHQARLDAKADYRRARKMIRDADHYDREAAHCDALAEWWEGRAYDDDGDNLQQAAQHRANAESLRRLAKANRARAPKYRQWSLDARARAARYDALEAERAQRIAEL